MATEEFYEVTHTNANMLTAAKGRVESRVDKVYELMTKVKQSVKLAAR